MAITDAPHPPPPPIRPTRLTLPLTLIGRNGTSLLRPHRSDIVDTLQSALIIRFLTPHASDPSEPESTFAIAM